MSELVKKIFPYGYKDEFIVLAKNAIPIVKIIVQTRFFVEIKLKNNY